MELKDSRQGEVVVVEISGEIDSRSAHELEQKLVDLLGEGMRFLVLDFRQVDQLTSAGLRVMVMVANRLAGSGGKLALASPSAHVSQVLEISGLGEYFAIVPSTAEAVAELSSTGTLSRVLRRALKLLAAGPEGGARGRRAPGVRAGSSETSKLSAQVAEILSGSASPTGGRGSKPDGSGTEPNDEGET
jgi:anti-anti-sigma factor